MLTLTAKRKLREVEILRQISPPGRRFKSPENPGAGFGINSDGERGIIDPSR